MHLWKNTLSCIYNNKFKSKHMRFPSLNTMVHKTTATLFRFPLAIMSAFLATFVAMHLVENETFDESMKAVNLLHTSILGIGFFIAVQLFIELFNLDLLKKIIVYALSIGVFIGYFFYLPYEYSLTHLYRAILLAITIHLLIASLPFVKQGKINGFWQYNKTLFLQILISALYSAVLYAGLSIAILAINFLFDAEISEKVFFHLWLILVGIFNTWFFLSGVPKDIQELDDDREYPLGLKIFTQYVLLPLVTIYLIILYGYLLKIIVLWSLPTGWVSYLVIGFSVAGILALLLIYPLSDSEKHKWIKIYSKLFYWALFPQVILLFIAIFSRINQYGITENRYFIMILAFWLAGISAFMLINKHRNIKIIPISLMIISFLSSLGPWSAFNVSEASQFNRLKKILVKNEILVEGKIHKLDKSINWEDEKEISHIINYLYENHGYSKLQHITNNDLKEMADSVKRYNFTYDYMKLMGLTYISDYENEPAQNIIDLNFSAENNIGKVLLVREYDYILNFDLYNYTTDENDSITVRTFELKDSVEFIMEFNKNSNILLIKKGDKIIQNELLPLIEQLRGINNNTYYIDQELLTLKNKNEFLSVKILFNNINGQIEENELFLSTLNGKLLIQEK